MKHNSIFTTIASVALAALTLGACSEIDQDDRHIYVEPTLVSKHVLIEDFTGQMCVNCPAGTDIIHELQQQYGDSVVIAVGLHSGPFGKNASGRPLPLYTETGDYYFGKYGVEAQPSAMIDRQGVNSVMMTWATQVRSEIAKESTVDLEALSTYDPATRTASIATNITAITGLTGATLQVWLTEDSIVSPQYFPGNKIERNYVHNHVFRAAVNDRDGDALNAQGGQVLSPTFTTPIAEAWVPEHMSVVVIVADDSGVLQVEKVPLVGEPAPASDRK